MLFVWPSSLEILTHIYFRLAGYSTVAAVWFEQLTTTSQKSTGIKIFGAQKGTLVAVSYG